MNKPILSRILLVCSLCICMSAARAQYVSIPDSNFGIWLNQNGYSSCLTSNGNNGNWQLDTTCPALLNTRSMHLDQNFDCTGLVYFKGLDTITLEQVVPLTLPIFPPSLRCLIMLTSGYTNQMVLPDSLQWLIMEDGLSDDSLPFAFPPTMIGFLCTEGGSTPYLPVMPNTFRYLSIEGLNFNSNVFNFNSNMFTSPLPDSLRYLDCYDTDIDTLPPLPPYLDTLICSDNANLRNIPALPSTLVYLDCWANSISALPALPAAMTYLDCGGNLMSSLPTLPPSLVHLECSADEFISSLPALPSTLKYLACGGNAISTLPTLPALTYLSCGKNPLHSLPATLPSTLTYLECGADSLSVMPSFPTGLTYINCGYNQLTSLPALPAPLTQMSCRNNLLTALPVLPASLTYFDCGYNRISVLPALPHSLYELDCPHNLLTSLPAAPANLGILECDSNNLIAITSLSPVLRLLSCRGNPMLSSISVLPDTIIYLDISNNPNLTCIPIITGYLSGYLDPSSPVDPTYAAVFTYEYLQYNWNSGMFIGGSGISCMPNRFLTPPAASDINPQTLPLCTPGSGCAFYYNISGDVHLDTAATCAGDSINPGNALKNVKINLLQSGQVLQQCVIDEYTGQYSFKVDTFGSYQVAVDTQYLRSLIPACPSANNYTLNISAADSVYFNQDFGMSCGSFDYATIYIFGHVFHPGFVREVDVEAGNLAQLNYNAACGGAMPGTFTTIISGAAQYVSPAAGSLTPTSVSPSGDTITYSISNLDSLHLYSLDINVMTDSTAVLGSSVCITGIITPDTPDANINDDTLTQCFTVSNSLDPNLKTVYPTTLTPDGGWLTYTVEFQNTGNDTAYTVVVRDTLSPYVDASSFQYVASDHKAVIQLMGNAMVFTFPRINLVDSATDPPLSTGWIQYKVKAKPNLPLNTQVKNTAYVYFDINPAVVTNTTVNTVDTTPAQPLAIRTVPAGSIHLYPNPNKGSFTLLTSGSVNSSYLITDMLGNVIKQEAITSSAMQIDMPDASEGVYTLTVKGSSPLRFVVVR